MIAVATSRIEEAIDQGITAEAAVERVQNNMRLRMSKMADDYLRDRLLDFEDLTNRLLSHLDGRPLGSGIENLPPDTVLVARSLGPAELLDYARAGLAGVVIEEGSLSSHVAIVARAIDLPVVGRCRGALTDIEPMDRVIVDADHQQVFVRPGEDIVEAYQHHRDVAEQRKRYYAALASEPARTCDGQRVELMMNAGLSIELNQLPALGADGVGLYRTEIPFMVRSAYPDVAAQTHLYRRVLDLAGDRPVYFRTLDVGGDKRLPFFPEQNEANPAMGWRAIRLGLDRPAMLRSQVRALLHAAEGRDLHLLFPMIASVAEFTDARRLVDLETARLAQLGRLGPKSVRVGAMIEVPGLLLQLDALCQAVDFLSIGTNDLLQFLFAADRENPRMTARYDPLAPAMITALDSIAAAARRHAVPVSVCGEMAARPLHAMALVGLGYHRLSMSASALGPVRAMLRSLDACAVTSYLQEIKGQSLHSLRHKLRAFALDHSVQLGGDTP